MKNITHISLGIMLFITIYNINSIDVKELFFKNKENILLYNISKNKLDQWNATIKDIGKSVEGNKDLTNYYNKLLDINKRLFELREFISVRPIATFPFFKVVLSDLNNNIQEIKKDLNKLYTSIYFFLAVASKTKQGKQFVLLLATALKDLCDKFINDYKNLKFVFLNIDPGTYENMFKNRNWWKNQELKDILNDFIYNGEKAPDLNDKIKKLVSDKNLKSRSATS